MYLTSHPLIRFSLKKPKKREPVWSKTHLSWSNIDISRDGRFMGGLFPWPDAGIAMLGKKQLEKVWKRVLDCIESR